MDQFDRERLHHPYLGLSLLLFLGMGCSAMDDSDFFIDGGLGRATAEGVDISLNAPQSDQDMGSYDEHEVDMGEPDAEGSLPELNDNGTPPNSEVQSDCALVLEALGIEDSSLCGEDGRGDDPVQPGAALTEEHLIPEPLYDFLLSEGHCLDLDLDGSLAGCKAPAAGSLPAYWLDCDDQSGRRAGHLKERCDGIDNNCDEQVDEPWRKDLEEGQPRLGDSCGAQSCAGTLTCAPSGAALQCLSDEGLICSATRLCGVNDPLPDTPCQLSVRQEPDAAGLFLQLTACPSDHALFLEGAGLDEPATLSIIRERGGAEPIIAATLALDFWPSEIGCGEQVIFWKNQLGLWSLELPELTQSLNEAPTQLVHPAEPSFEFPSRVWTLREDQLLLRLRNTEEYQLRSALEPERAPRWLKRPSEAIPATLLAVNAQGALWSLADAAGGQQLALSPLIFGDTPQDPLSAEELLPVTLPQRSSEEALLGEAWVAWRERQGPLAIRAVNSEPLQVGPISFLLEGGRESGVNQLQQLSRGRVFSLRGTRPIFYQLESGEEIALPYQLEGPGRIMGDWFLFVSDGALLAAPLDSPLTNARE